MSPRCFPIRCRHAVDFLLCASKGAAEFELTSEQGSEGILGQAPAKQQPRCRGGIEKDMPHNNPPNGQYQELILEFTRLPNFCHILQGGFRIATRAGISVRELLCEQLQIDSAYVEERLSTVFLDGKPVDDMQAATLEDGSTLALSAAMPGLVGATMRRGGHYAALRRSIAYQRGGEQRPHEAGMITLKLFNLVADQLGPQFLARGVLLEGRTLAKYLKSREAVFWKACRAALLNGSELNPTDLKDGRCLEKADLMKFKVCVPE